MVKKILALASIIVGIGLVVLAIITLMNNQIFIAVLWGLTGIACIIAGSLLFSSKKSMHDFFDDLTSFMP